MIKKLLSTCAALVMGLCLFCGCGQKPPPQIEDKPFYTLEEAYDYGWLSKNDLKSIANKINNRESIDLDELDGEVLTEIKTAYALLRDTESDEVGVAYYGNFKSYYAVDVFVKGDGASDVITKVYVGGGVFIYPNDGTEVVIYKFK